MRAAVERLGIEYPVLIDSDLRMWNAYDNEGWPARYLWGATETGHVLREFHYGEGGYRETELAIQEELGISRDAAAADPARGRPRGAHRRADPRAAGRVVGALPGRRRVGGALRRPASCAPTAPRSRSTHPGAYPLVEHPRHTTGVLDLEVGDGVTCHARVVHPGRRSLSTLRTCGGVPGSGPTSTTVPG